MRRFSWFPLVAVFTLMVPAASGFDGNNDKSAADKPARPNKEAAKAVVTPEMETEATRFVREHHPELVELLTQLKTGNPSQYQQAIRDLSRAATTLATTEKNDPKKYVLDLHAWQVNSQIQMLAARLAMAPTQELKDELKARLRDQIDIRLEQQKLDRDRTESRLKKLNESIAKLEGSRDQEADKAFDKLTRTTQKPTPRRENKAATTGPKKSDAVKPKNAQ